MFETTGSVSRSRPRTSIIRGIQAVCIAFFSGRYAGVSAPTIGEDGGRSGGSEQSLNRPCGHSWQYRNHLVAGEIAAHHTVAEPLRIRLCHETPVFGSRDESPASTRRPALRTGRSCVGRSVGLSQTSPSEVN